MNRWAKLGIVLAGYVLAMAASVVAVLIYDTRFTPQDNQTMGGMIAGGEMIYGSAVFLLVSLVPTGLALWFLRQSRVFWTLFAALVLAFAVGGLGAVLAPVAAPGGPTSIPLLVGLFGIVQMLGSPLWIGSFALFATLAPERGLRRCMLAAVGIELVIAVCGVLHFFSPMPPI